MLDQMTRWGVGPRFAGLSILFGSLALLLTHLSGDLFRMNFMPYEILAPAGIVLIIAGLSVSLTAFVTVTRAFNTGQLVTTGVYAICRNPSYSAWVFLIAPGIMLLANTWLGMTTVPIMYAILSILVKTEERYLKDRFGSEYAEYRNRVPSILPVGRLASVSRDSTKSVESKVT